MLCSLVTVETADEDASLWLSLACWFNGEDSLGSKWCSDDDVDVVVVVKAVFVVGTILTTTDFPFWLWFDIWFYAAYRARGEIERWNKNGDIFLEFYNSTFKARLKKTVWSFVQVTTKYFEGATNRDNANRILLTIFCDDLMSIKNSLETLNNTEP